MVDGLAYLDLDPYGRELDDPLAELEQDLVHRLLEQPGSNIADEDRGVGIFAMLSGSVNIPALARVIEADFVKDPRVASVGVSIQAIGDGFYLIEIEVVCNEGELGINLEVSADGTVRKAK